MKKGLVTRKNMADNLSLVSTKKENDINKKTWDKFLSYRLKISNKINIDK